MLILDLYSEVNPLFNQTESFYGQPFVWCMLGSCFQDISFYQIWRKRVIVKTPQGNFGGDTGWYGVIPDINDSLDAAQRYPNSTLVGTAIVPEGLFQNEFVYDYTLQLGKMALAVWARQRSRAISILTTQSSNYSGYDGKMDPEIENFVRFWLRSRYNLAEVDEVC